MIVVKIELWPKGVPGSAIEIGRMYIANDGTGSENVGNYDGVLCRRGTIDIPEPLSPFGPQGTRQGRVENHKRRSLVVWKLIQKMLNSMFMGEK